MVPAYPIQPNPLCGRGSRVSSPCVVSGRISSSRGRTSGADESPPAWFYVGLFDDYVDSGRGRGVERSKEDLEAAHGSDSGLVVLQVTASEQRFK